VRVNVPAVVSRVGQNRIYTPYMAVYLVISLPRIVYIHRIYTVMANSSHELSSCHEAHAPNKHALCVCLCLCVFMCLQT
jgi:hypothetical protein